MDSATWQLQHAKNRFSEVVDRALGGTPQWVTRRGKPAVCVVAADDYERLAEQHRRRPKDVLRGSPHPDVDIVIDRDASPGREVEL